MTDQTEDQIKSSFRTLFPAFAGQLDLATDDAAIGKVVESLFTNAQAELSEQLTQAGFDKSDVTSSGAIFLSPWRYARLVKATGDVVKTELLDLIDSLQKLKGKEHAPKAEFAGAMVAAGVPAVMPITPPATPSPPFVVAIEEGAGELAAAEGGLATTPPGLVIAIVVLVVIAILVLIWFMDKPSNCISLLINESDKALDFAGDHNVSGKPATITPFIPAAVKDDKSALYPAAGFFVSDRKAGFYGTQYGFSMKHPVGHLAFGMCCTLTGVGGPNSCFCHVGGTAEHASIDTDKYRKQYYEDLHNGQIKISIRCNSKSGSPAYFIARAFS